MIVSARCIKRLTGRGRGSTPQNLISREGLSRVGPDDTCCHLTADLTANATANVCGQCLWMSLPRDHITSQAAPWGLSMPEVASPSLNASNPDSSLILLSCVRHVFQQRVQTPSGHLNPTQSEVVIWNQRVKASSESSG